MCRDATHSMESDRTTDHLIVLFAFHISPRLVDYDFFFKGSVRDFRCDAARLAGRHARDSGAVGGGDGPEPGDEYE